MLWTTFRSGSLHPFLFPIRQAAGWGPCGSSDVGRHIAARPEGNGLRGDDARALLPTCDTITALDEVHEATICCGVEHSTVMMAISAFDIHIGLELLPSGTARPALRLCWCLALFESHSAE
jgi:hypothetical protein